MTPRDMADAGAVPAIVAPADSGQRTGTALGAGTPCGQRFVIQRLIREGSQGRIYLAEERESGRSVMLWLFSAPAAALPELGTALAKLVLAHEGLRSRHILRYQSSGLDEALGAAWIESEAPEGVPLDEWLPAGDAMPAAQAAALLSQLASALRESHAQGLCHGDLRPSQIWIAARPTGEGDSCLYVAGLGLQEHVRSTSVGKGTIRAALQWGAPELLSPGSAASPMADVWSFGLLSFRLLSGQTYWRGASRGPQHSLQVLREVTLEALEPASLRAKFLGYSGGLPVGFDEWLQRCLARSTSERFPDVATAFEAFPRAACQVFRGDLPALGQVQPLDRSPKPSAARRLDSPAGRWRARLGSGRSGARWVLSLGLFAGGLVASFASVKQRAEPPRSPGPRHPMAMSAAPPPALTAPAPRAPRTVEPSAPPPPSRRPEPAPVAKLCSTAEQCFGRGQRYLRLGELAPALNHFAFACQRRHAESCQLAAEMLDRGLGTPANPSRALRLYQRACSEGQADSCLRYRDRLHQLCEQGDRAACKSLSQFLHRPPDLDPPTAPPTAPIFSI